MECRNVPSVQPQCNNGGVNIMGMGPVGFPRHQTQNGWGSYTAFDTWSVNLHVLFNSIIAKLNEVIEAVRVLGNDQHLLEERMGTRVREINDLERRITTTEVGQNNLVLEKDNMITRMGSRILEIQDLTNRLDNMHQRIDGMQQQVRLNTNANNSNELREQINAANRQIADISARADLLRAESRQGLEREVISVEVRVSEGMANLTNQMSSYNQRISDVEQQMVGLNRNANNSNNLCEQINAANRQIEVISANTKLLSGRVRTNTDANILTQSQISELLEWKEEKSNELNQEIQVCTSVNMVLNDQIQQLLGGKIILENKIAKLEDVNSKLQQQVSEINWRLNEFINLYSESALNK